jgi:DNA-binding NarL/FixJ family response regulator
LPEAGIQVSSKKIKIFLSDPQVLFREGIHFILSGEDDLEVTGEGISNEEALSHIETNPPQVVILNIADKKLGGLQLVRRLKRRSPSISAILTLEDKDEEQLFEVLRSGASAYLTKDTDPEHLLETVRAVAQGDLPIMEEILNPAMANRTLAEFEEISELNGGMDSLMAGLAPKETQILDTIAAGNSLEQVAAKLNMDEESIRANLKLVLNKLVANDQTRAVIMTVRRSLPGVMVDSSRPTGFFEEYLTREEFDKFKDSLAKSL